MDKGKLLAAVVVIPRLALLLLDSFTEGFFATRVVEFWFYYGVADGSFSLQLLDPTLWLLRPLGLLPSGAVLVGALKILAILLSTATAFGVLAVGRRLFGKELAFYSAVFYSSIVEVVMISQGFTHDLVVLPLLLWALALLLDGRKLGWLLLFLTAFANPLFVFVLFALGAKKVADRLPRRKALAVLVVLALAFHLLLQLSFPLMSNLVAPARGMSLVDQRAARSIDMLPAKPLFYLENYHILLAFAAAGLLVAVRRKEWVSVSIALFGLAVATFVGRGMIVLDVGIALLAGLGFSRFHRRLWPLAIAVGVGVLLLSPSPEVTAFATSQDDYFAFSSLRGESGRILTRWDRGYMAQALSGLEAVSTPENIDFYMQNSVMLTPALARERLEGVDFLAIKQGQFYSMPAGSLADRIYRGETPDGFALIYGKANNTVRIFKIG